MDVRAGIDVPGSIGKFPRKAIIAIIIISAVILAIIIGTYVYCEPLLTTVYEEKNYTHAAARDIIINVCCEDGYAPLRCPVNVYNSTGGEIVITIKTVVPKSAEYKGDDRVFEHFKKNVSFTRVDDCLLVDVKVIGGSRMFMIRPGRAGVDIYIPAGTSYFINQTHVD